MRTRNETPARTVAARTARAGACAVALLLVLAALPAAAAPRAASPNPNTTATIQFPLADGWDGGTLRYSPLSEVLILKFKRGVGDPATSLSPTLGRTERRIFSRVEAVPNERGSMTVRVHVERRGYEASLRKNRRTRSWELSVTLPPPDDLPPVSYASFLPEGPARDALLEAERAMGEGDPSCRPLVTLRRTGEPWAAWAALRLADCLRQSGELGGSVGLALDLAGNPDVPPAVAALASLRLEEWAMNLHSALEPTISPAIVASLPREVAFELGLRVARTLAFRERGRDAAAALHAASRLGEVPPPLAEAVQALRLLVMHQLTEQEAWFEAARLFAAFPLPSLGSAAREGTIRLSTLAVARLGLVDRAMGIGSVILRTGGKVVDPELKSALAEALLALGRKAEAAEILVDTSLHLDPSEGGMLFGAAEGRAVAARLLSVWDGYGLGAAMKLLSAVDAADPAGLVESVRLAALLADGDCAALEAAPPAGLPAGYLAWAAACWIGVGEDASAAGAAVRDMVAPGARASDELSLALVSHATRSADFFARMDARMNPAPLVAPAPAAEPEPAAEQKPRRRGRRSR